jgi:hypothetical protein
MKLGIESAPILPRDERDTAEATKVRCPWTSARSQQPCSLPYSHEGLHSFEQTSAPRVMTGGANVDQAANTGPISLADRDAEESAPFGDRSNEAPPERVWIVWSRGDAHVDGAYPHEQAARMSVEATRALGHDDVVEGPYVRGGESSRPIPWPPSGSGSITRAGMVARVCQLLHRVWEAHDPDASEPNDCFCHDNGMRFQHSGQSLKWLEALVDQALKAIPGSDSSRAGEKP